MEGKYSIEVVEMVCANETDGNAQVTSPVSVDDVQCAKEVEYEEMLHENRVKGNEGQSGIGFMMTNAATNWILFGILIMLFMFMIFKCE